MDCITVPQLEYTAANFQYIFNSLNVSIHQFSRLTGVDRHTIRSWIQDGVTPDVRKLFNVIKAMEELGYVMPALPGLTTQQVMDTLRGMEGIQRTASVLGETPHMIRHWRGASVVPKIATLVRLEKSIRANAPEYFGA